MIRSSPKCDRSVSVYGYLRGTLLKKQQSLHLAGVGDFPIQDIAFLPDPCPLPDGEKKRTLVEKDKSIYAPMSGVGGIVYDKDAVYIELGGSHSHKKPEEEGGAMVEGIIATETTLNEKLEKSELRLLTGSVPMSSVEAREIQEAEGRKRRKAVFKDGKEDVDSSEDGEEGDESGDEEEEDEEEDEDMEGSGDEEASEPKSSGLKVESTPELPKVNKRTNEESDPRKTSKKKKFGSINDQILKEMGEDLESGSELESDDEDETKDEENEENNPHETKFDGKTQPQKDSKVFHHRLTTKADISAHSRVAEALSKISEKEATIKEDESEEEESENEESNEDDNDVEAEESGQDEDEDDEVEDNVEVADDNDDDSTIALHWKADLAMKARDSFYSRQSGTLSLRRLVYGQEERGEGGEEEAETVGGLFTLKKGGEPGLRKQEMHGLDCSVWRAEEQEQDWGLEDVRSRIRDCFVTGSWAKGRDAEELMKLDDEDEDEVYGDFEDLETGDKISGKKEDEEEEEDKPNTVNYGGDREKELAKRKERMERKLKLKRTFDTDYDGGEGGEKSTYYEDLKKEVDDQSQLNRGEFEGMEDSLRVQYEGYRPGMYVRLELGGVPCELVDHLDPTFPLLLGGLLKGEEQLGFLQVRLKKHRWYPKILKNKDPLIISLGELESLPDV